MSPLDRFPDSSISPTAAALAHGSDERGAEDWLGLLFRGVDAFLRRNMGIRQFCAEPRCVIRVRMAIAAADVVLADGTAIRRGDPVGELHLWNEQLPRIPVTGPGVGWAFAMRRAFAHSLALLARHVAEGGEFSQADAFCAAIAFAGPRSRATKVARAAARNGFELIDPQPTFATALRAFADGIFILCLIRAFNPAGLTNARLTRRRYQIWISKRRLIERHCGRQTR